MPLPKATKSALLSCFGSVDLPGSSVHQIELAPGVHDSRFDVARPLWTRAPSVRVGTL